MFSRKINLFFSFIVLLLISCGENPAKESVYSGNALGTTFHITYFDEKGYDAEKGIDSVFQAINQSMSTYLKNSDISKINDGDSTVIVDSMFADVFRISKKIHEETGGYFDPTVGKLVNFYGFGPESMHIKIDSAAIDSLMEFVGFDKIKLTSENKLKKSTPNIYLDFNAIAKGYAVDRLGKLLEQQGIENYLVEVGGELVVKGENLAKGKSWTVGIDDPNNTLQNPSAAKGLPTARRELSAIIELKNQGMATSGNYRKFRVDPVTGKKYVHTIDPKTGFPARNALLSATVLAKNCALADAYATSLMAMGLEKAKEFLQTKTGLEVYLIYAQADSVGVFMTEGFETQLVKD